MVSSSGGVVYKLYILHPELGKLIREGEMMR
jgi:hypothetical protein